MTQEEKQLLLVDLSARLPYGVKIRMIHHEIKDADPEYVDDVFSTTHYNMIDYDDDNYEFLPYLRLMSSMTKEEKETYHNLCYEEERENFEFGEWVTRVYYHDTIDSIDYLNSIHVDYRGLIPKGLAIEVPEGMYRKEKQL